MIGVSELSKACGKIGTHGRKCLLLTNGGPYAPNMGIVELEAPCADEQLRNAGIGNPLVLERYARAWLGLECDRLERVAEEPRRLRDRARRFSYLI